MNGLDSRAYLIRLRDKAADITISNMTLRGPALHGAVFGLVNENLSLHDLRIEDFLWSGVRTLKTSQSSIRNCDFVDAGGKWKRGGIPGTDGGISGGAIFMVWASDCEIAHNRIYRTRSGRERAHFGIKGRGGRRLHIHHNTIDVNFSIEFPFEGIEGFSIDHNVLRGVVSIPKFGGGRVPDDGRTFDIHHNYFTTSYAIEFVRNGVAIHHNLFDLDPTRDKGNLIGSFGAEPAAGPAVFHNNLVSNPGRGVFWCRAPFNHVTFRNNHIVTRTTATPRTDGLFGMSGNSDFSTISIVDNVVECIGQPRPLLRNDASASATIRNNRLSNVADVDRYENPTTDAKPGLEEPLGFRCGSHGELTIDGWDAQPTGGEAFRPTWVASRGIVAPESVCFDPETDRLYVSLLGAKDGGEKDGDGAIAVLDVRGNVIDPKWIEGLDGPKGMAVQGGTLHVSDIDQVVLIDVAKGEVRKRIPIPNAKFLNDVACDDNGVVYVSDFFGNGIWKLTGETPELLVEGEQLEHPNGLCIAKGGLHFASWGRGMREDFSTETGGRVWRIDLESRESSVVTPKPTANFDGLVPDGHDGFYATDWLAGRVLHVSEKGNVRVLAELGQGAADLVFVPQHRLLIVPEMKRNRVSAFRLP